MDLESKEWELCKKRKEEELILMIRMGGFEERRAINCLFERWFYLVHQMKKEFGSLTIDEVISAYSEAMIVLREMILSGKYKGIGTLKGLFYKIFYYRSVDITRRKEPILTIGKSLPNVPDQESIIIEQEELEKMILEREARLELMKVALGKLSEKCRKIILLQSQKKKFDEIAECLKLKNAHTARQTYYRCKNNLKQVVEDLKN